jgi:hypothetical protein
VLTSTYNVAIVAESVSGKIAVNTYRAGLFGHQWNDICFNQSIALAIVLQFFVKRPSKGTYTVRLQASAAGDGRQVWRRQGHFW